MVIDPPKTTASGDASAGGQQPNDWHFNFASSSVSQTAAQSPSVTVGGPANDHFVFQPGVDHSGNAVASAFADFGSAHVNEHLAALLHDTQTPQSPLFGGTNDGPGSFVDFGNHNDLTANAHLTDLHSSLFFH